MLGSLFVRSIDTAENISIAMQARGFDGKWRSVSKLRFKRCDLIFVTFLFSYLFVQYPWIAVIELSIILLFITLNILTKSLKPSLKLIFIPLALQLVILLIPSIFGIIIGIGKGIHFLDVTEFFSYMWSVYGSDFRLEYIHPSYFVSFFNRPFYSYFVDSPILLILTLIGMLKLLSSTNLDKTSILFRNMLFSWLFIISLIIIITPLQGYRLVLNYPVPIFSAIGLKFLVGFVRLILISFRSVKIELIR